MKIYKVASGGKRSVKIVFDMDSGEYKVTVTGHSEGASCSDELDEALAKFLVGTDDVLDEGNTSEAYETAPKIMAPKIPAKVKTTPSDDGGINPFDTVQQKKTLDKGFGV